MAGVSVPDIGLVREARKRAGTPAGRRGGGASSDRADATAVRVAYRHSCRRSTGGHTVLSAFANRRPDSLEHVGTALVIENDPSDDLRRLGEWLTEAELELTVV